MGLGYADEEGYIKVFLAMSGDFFSYNESREAKKLVRWFRSFGVLRLQQAVLSQQLAVGSPQSAVLSQQSSVSSTRYPAPSETLNID